MTNIMRKICLMFTALVIMVSALFTSGVSSAFAEDAPPTAENSTTMRQSMVSFFRESNVTLQTDRVARDEIIVYGIFLSNFYKPWSTTIKDIKDDSSDKSLSKEVAKRFFGSTDKSGEVSAINGKVSKAISDVLSADKKRFEIYASEPNEASAPITGAEFMKKLVSTEKEELLYTNGTTRKMNLKSPEMMSSMKILFGIEPNMFISKDRGMSKITAMYLDGFGNIWGAMDGVGPDDYVLIMPAVLNPYTHATVSNSNSVKFPVANTFVLGASLKMKDSISVNANNYYTPYYNIMGIANSEYDKNNLVNVYGIYSPMNHIGKSDKIIKGTADEKFFNQQVKPFVEEGIENLKVFDNAKILVTLNSKLMPDSVYTALEQSSYSEEQKAQFMEYFTMTTVLGLDDINDDMYFFNTTLVSSTQAADSDTGTFQNIENLIVKSKLYYRMNDGDFQFHARSSFRSPFSNFHELYLQATDKEEFLEKFGIETTDTAVMNAIKAFLETGTWGNRKTSVIKSAMATLMKEERIFGMLPKVNGIEKVVTEKQLKWFAKRTEVTAPSLTSQDKYAIYMSVGKKIYESYIYVENNAPFEVNGDGGKLYDTDSYQSVLKISTYFHNFMTYRVFGMNASFSQNLTGTKAGDKEFKTPWNKYTPKTSIMDDVNNYAGMYWGLMVNLLHIEPEEDDEGNTKFSDPEPFENSYLPYMEIDTLGGTLDLNNALGTAGLVASDNVSLEEMQRDIVKKVYGILQTGTSSYRDQLVKSFQDSWVLSTHRAIVGTWADQFSVSAGSGGSYASSVNFISMPSLSDLPLTEWLVDDYIYVYMLLMLFILAVLLLFYITNRRTIQEIALIGIVIAFVMILPQFVVNNVLQLSNKVSDSIYSEKFDYWAIVQHQQSVESLANSRATVDDLDYIIANAMQDAENAYSSDAGVRIKWMSPKKDDNFDRIFNESTSSKGLLENLKIFRWLFNSQLNQDEYVYNDPLATYVYRPYNSIVRDASQLYAAATEEEFTSRIALDNVLRKNDSFVGKTDHRFATYKTSRTSIKYSNQQEKLIKEARIYTPSSGEDILDAYRYWALGSSEVTTAIFRRDYTTNPGLSLVTQKDNISYRTFLAYTESPYFYFYNVFSSRYSYGNTSFKDSLLRKDTFVVNSTNLQIDGTLRDFLDLEGLFSYVIPYLKQSNDYVYGWTSLNGKTIEGYDFSNGQAPTVTEDMSAEEIALATEISDRYSNEKDKKENLKKVWQMYTPWVDSMYDLSTSYSAKAKVAEKTIEVPDALNPGSYESLGRPMIFSEADMRAKSYRYSDLSDIERRMQAVLDNTYEDLMYLVNYYEFKDEVLLSMAAMYATFNFNEEFSENSLIGESVVMYPQNFEMKNFNYDAFMRLILLNSTGEALVNTSTTQTDLYSTILGKTSIFTGIMLIVCDILGVTVIPAMKILVVLLILLLTIALALTLVLSPPEKIFKTLVRQLGLPIFIFLVSNIIFSWVIGVFMGDGLEGYVGSQSQSMNITDPTITMVLLAVADIVFIFVLFKLIKMLIDSLKTYCTQSLFSTMELVAQAGGKAISSARDTINRRSNNKRHNEMLDAMRGGSGDGSGGGSGGSGGASGKRGGGGLPPVVMPPAPPPSGGGSNGSGSNTDKLSSKFNDKASNLKTSAKNGLVKAGNRMVDMKHAGTKLKYSAQNATGYVKSGQMTADAKAGAKVLGNRMKNTAVSGANKVTGAVNSGVNATKRGANKVRTGASEYASQVRQYEIDKRKKMQNSVSNMRYISDASKNKMVDKYESKRYNSTLKQMNASDTRQKLRAKYNQ